MRLSSLADYAIVMMSAAARHCGHARVNATSLAAETRIPLPTAQKLVSKLSAAGLFESTRGSGGGVRLARPPAAISLADIVEAVEGPIQLTTCLDTERHDCALRGCCQVRPHMGVVNEALRGALARVSLARLAARPGVPELVEGHSFSSHSARDREGFDKLSQAGFGLVAEAAR